MQLCGGPEGRCGSAPRRGDCDAVTPCGLPGGQNTKSVLLRHPGFRLLRNYGPTSWPCTPEPIHTRHPVETSDQFQESAAAVPVSETPRHCSVDSCKELGHRQCQQGQFENRRRSSSHLSTPGDTSRMDPGKGVRGESLVQRSYTRQRLFQPARAPVGSPTLRR